ncbi:unnamed protein product [Eruca vesicaria subsp. sativa]|uniref:Uncharacterized protein n=1 Tax=Eruca vesicaria subsp. sativa TaxID=29727 RepID=A0ABC8LDE8_ERUVS|nr:unnamed protein product [Eruca vesicaria subsp. sativa]
MRNCKRPPRPHTRSQGRPSRDLLYQPPTDYSDEESQRILEFMKKLKQADLDEPSLLLVHRFCSAIRLYRSGYATYTNIKNGCLSILHDNQGLLDEFLQLLSSFNSPVIIRNSEKKENAESDLERTVGFLKKIEALGDNVHRAFISAFAFPVDIETLMEQVDEILRDHTSLKEEFRKFLVDSRLLKRKREESVEVTPSYQIRPEAEVGSSSNGVLNEKYYLDSPFDPEVASKKKIKRCLDKPRNTLEDRYMKDDMLMRDLAAVIWFAKDALKGKKRVKKPPLGFNRVLDWFYDGKEVPQEYKTYPNRAAIHMLPRMEDEHKMMIKAKTSRMIRAYSRANRSEG